MKKTVCFFLFATIIGTAFNSYADGFYVIPAVKEKIVEVEVPVCNDATSIGAKAFDLEVPEYGYISLKVGQVLVTKTGKLIEITGQYMGYVIYYESDFFYVAPATLPNPDVGVKGPFYFLQLGSIAYAKYL